MSELNPEITSGSYQSRLYEECRSAGWDPELRNTFAEEIAHLHEELSEAFRALRQYHDYEIHYDDNGKPQGIPIELADVMIGLFYNAELHDFDLFNEVEIKHRYNLTRNYVTEGRQLHANSKPSQITVNSLTEHSNYDKTIKQETNDQNDEYSNMCIECQDDSTYTVSVGGGVAGPCQTCLGMSRYNQTVHVKDIVTPSEAKDV
ncbi:MAG: hypothetical protein NVSMB46_03540 [Candidatus Saccharimonadales bacterium]